MSYDDEIKEALSFFATAKADDEDANRTFTKGWEQKRNDEILPLFERTEEIFNNTTADTGLTAEGKRDNGSVILTIAETGKELGKIVFKAEQRRIICWEYRDLGHSDGKSETFDLATLDVRALESKVETFIKMFLERRKPKT